MNNDKQTTTKPKSLDGSSRMPNRPQGPGIEAIHVNAARQMVQLHTRGRNPPLQQLPQSRNPMQQQLDSTRGKSLGNLPPSNSSSTATITPASSSASSTSSVFPKPRISIPARTRHEECKNPQCPHCGSIIIPSPQSSLPVQDQPSLKVNNWEIYTVKKPILSSAELDYLGDHEFEFPLPEMIFGNNVVRVKYNRLEEEEVGDKGGDDGRGTETKGGAGIKDDSEIWFNAVDALKTLDDECHLKVSYHEEWLESRQKKSKSRKQQVEKRGGDAVPSTDTGATAEELINSDGIKPYDWTYSTNYKGRSKNFKFISGEKGESGEDVEIPIARLTQPDPILFFDEMILFEDELADNGISMLSIKIRVMPTCLLILCRFFLRIDNVIFRIRDCRVFIDLDRDEIIREYKLQECDYDKVLRISMGTGAGAGNDPKKLLRDQNWVSLNIPVIERSIEKCTL
ncbi:uncharacterized protein LODBEIA_P54070 [Lodderomyces beijingensis]|uniref:Type 2A phosphatase activator TIP41 n=1 Tax=Lodderomyces beijingensis TaxID=1775926 RepID=A0ABP0ZSS2_9ASCO